VISTFYKLFSSKTSNDSIKIEYLPQNNLKMITQPENISQPNIAEIGGKAANLIRLAQTLGADFRVPKWVVLSKSELQNLAPESLKTSQNAAEWADFIQKTTFPDHLADEIAANFSPETLFAVRSSAVNEDGAAHSFAGQFESHLFVKKHQLLDAIRTVWASSCSERVQFYCRQKSVEWQPGIAVIIQEMVDADVAGVGFGLNPVSGDRETKVISSVFGVGEGLVSGELDSDNFFVKNGKIEAQIAEKTEAFKFDFENGGVHKVLINSDLQKKSTLTEVQIFDLEKILARLENELGHPQDIEFAVKNDQIFLLQTRPITTIISDAASPVSGFGAAKPEIKNPKSEIVWDNSNIIESYPDLSLPLTFSFIVPMYEAVYVQLVGLLGAEKWVIDQNRPIFLQMLGLLNGRIYYNLRGWYAALALLPGYKLNARFMETMMGVKERFDVPVPARSRVGAWWAVVRGAVKMVGQLRGLPAERGRFKALIFRELDQFRGVDLAKKSATELRDLYFRLENLLVKEWNAPMVNDFFAMIFFGLLKKQAEKIGDENLHNDLLAGSQNILSAEPVHRLRAISEAIRSDEKCLDFFLENDVDFISKKMTSGAFPEVNALIISYLDKFGDRCPGELKLETETYSQRPESFLAIVQGHIRNAKSAHFVENKGFDHQKIRREAEAKTTQFFGGNFLKKAVFNFIKNKARDLVSERENLRFERTRAFAVVRRIFLGIGADFHRNQLLSDPRDIFYLTKNEIFDFINGMSPDANLKRFVELRKAQYVDYQQIAEMPERIKTNGTVNPIQLFTEKADAETQNNFDKKRKGIGCCAGIVRGRVRIVRSPMETPSCEGDLMVCAHTDPGWVTLFPTAAGILVERGSLLSHAAIVSRELGIPCIVGLTGILSVLKTGDLVEMNGATGDLVVLE
jgi:rifampicin phosphotransferase